jgi:cytochrome c oxidase subunit 3
MSVIVIFMVLIAAIAFWWLSHQRLMAKPWLEVGIIGEDGGDAGGEVGRRPPSPVPTAKIGLRVFLAVAGSLFALLFSAYSMRMSMPDWRTLPVPAVLWFNTILLMFSSIALQTAVVAGRRDDFAGVQITLIVAYVSSLAFLVGQVLAWGQLVASGYFAAGNPANAFFYLITAIHGLHVLGGLVALDRTTAKVFDRTKPSRPLDELRLSVGLCATYWHFLLLVWLVLFSFLMHWASDFVSFCRAALT